MNLSVGQAIIGLAMLAVVILCWPMIEIVMSELGGFANKMAHAYHDNRASRAGLDDDMIDPASSEIVRFRDRARLERVRAHANVGECQAFKGQLFCTSDTYGPACRYDEAISLYWCVRD